MITEHAANGRCQSANRSETLVQSELPLRFRNPMTVIYTLSRNHVKKIHKSRAKITSSSGSWTPCLTGQNPRGGTGTNTRTRTRSCRRDYIAHRSPESVTGTSSKNLKTLLCVRGGTEGDSTADRTRGRTKAGKHLLRVESRPELNIWSALSRSPSRSLSEY